MRTFDAPTCGVCGVLHTFLKNFAKEKGPLMDPKELGEIS
jgi:hypothetical protein